MATNNEEGIADEALHRLLEGRDPATVFESGVWSDELKKRLAERMLNAEMNHHLGEGAEQEVNRRFFGYRFPVYGSLLRRYLWLQIIAGWLLSARFSSRAWDTDSASAFSAGSCGT